MANRNGLLSLIIISYRNTDGIYETIDSAFRQTYAPIEIIISDDGTPGFSEKKAEVQEYAEKNRPSNITRIEILSSQENQGTVKNINRALEEAQGDYIKVLAAEDCFAKQAALRTYVDFLESHDFEICFAKMVGITPEGDIRGNLTSCEYDYEKLSRFTPEEMEERLFARNCLPAPAWCAKRSLFETYGQFPELVRLIEDYPFWLQLTHANVPFGFIDEVLIYYRLSGVSSAGSYSEMFMNDMFAIYNEYIFPHDKRFGPLQPVYNKLKVAGLNYYMTKARWNSLPALKKVVARVKYAPFSLYTYMQRKSSK